GAGSGLGEAAALALARAGADLALIGRTRDELEETADKVRQLKRKASALVVDIADETAMRGAFGQIEADFGRLDIAFANAGINGTWAPIDELTYDEWNET